MVRKGRIKKNKNEGQKAKILYDKDKLITYCSLCGNIVYDGEGACFTCGATLISKNDLINDIKVI